MVSQEEKKEMKIVVCIKQVPDTTEVKIDPVKGTIIREAFAMGADKAYHLSDRRFAGADTLATSNALAGALRRLDYDLIITGRQAIDGDTAQVGPQIAEHLGLPQVSYVESLSYDGKDKLTCKKATEEGYQMVEVQMPCVLTAVTPVKEARYMSIRGILEAYGKEVEESKLGLKGSPTRVAKSFTKGAKAAGEVHELTPEEAVDLIIEKLQEKFII